MDVKAGAHYFDGWTGETYHITERLRTEFPEREPRWGWVTSTPEIMVEQIDAAADAGLEFWSFCWYYPEKEEKHCVLNQALDLYLQAPNRERLEFCPMIANHAGFRVGPEDWDACCEAWGPLLNHELCLKANGRPLIIFFSPYELVQKFGSDDAVAQALDVLRSRAGDVVVAGCSGDGKEAAALARRGFDAVTGYNYAGAGRKGDAKDQPFRNLIEGQQAVWDGFAGSPLPYIPLASVGWDMRPWEARDLPEEKQSVRFTDRSPDAVEELVRLEAAWVRQHPQVATREKLLLLYAWNENGEGSYLTPGKADGDIYLQAVKRGLRG
jgi:hypothetical protein